MLKAIKNQDVLVALVEKTYEDNEVVSWDVTNVAEDKYFIMRRNLP